MLARLELKLACKEELAYQMSSLFHGALMELMDEEYADYLHLSQLHPYTQHLEYRDGSWYWIICCMNKEAVQKIIRDALWNIQSVKIKKRNLEVAIIQKNYEEMTYKELMNIFYDGAATSYIQIQFLSPTAFKQNGRYIFYPDIRCIFQSLMKKYDVSVGRETMTDSDTLEELCKNARVIRYDLKSVNFSLEGVKIPSFVGKITIKMNGTKTMANFANMLFYFGTYSGVGIKASLGMGCIRLITERGH